MPVQQGLTGKVSWVPRVIALGMTCLLGWELLQLQRFPSGNEQVLAATAAAQAQLIVRMAAVNRSIVGLMVLQTAFFAALAAWLWLRAKAATLEKAALRALAEDLSRANTQALDASRGKSQFLANMSHELRTPLNGMLGMLGLLEGTRIDPVQQDYIITARNSARHLLTLLNDVLDLSSFDAGKFQLKFDDMHFLGALYEVESVMRPLAEDKHLVLNLAVDSDVPRWVVGDHTRIKQIVLNLVSNAIKFSDRGEVAVRVRRDDSRSSKVHNTVGVTIEVADQGIGIDAPTCERLFHRFEQGDGGTARRNEGTGLGLEISRELARLMHGDIRVDSTPGQGSTFTVSLVLQRAPEPPPTGPLPVSGLFDLPASVPLPDARALDILVADDNSTNRKYMGSLLGSMGHSVRFAEDGEEAVAQVHRQLPDLLLMDLHMPVMDGFDAVKQLRQVPGPTVTLPIVALTADVWDETRERAMACGMNGFLTKPVDTLALEACIVGHFPGLIASVTLDSEPPEPPVTDPCQVILLGSDVQKLRATDISTHIQLTMVAEVCFIMGRAVYAELVADFGRAGSGNLQRLLGALENFDTTQEVVLRDIAHSVKGEAAGLGLLALSDVARDAELAAQPLDADACRRYASKMKVLWDTSMVLLEKLGFIEITQGSLRPSSQVA